MKPDLRSLEDFGGLSVERDLIGWANDATRRYCPENVYEIVCKKARFAGSGDRALSFNLSLWTKLLHIRCHD